jgi:hypothetical protein
VDPRGVSLNLQDPWGEHHPVGEEYFGTQRQKDAHLGMFFNRRPKAQNHANLNKIQSQK